MRGCLTLILGLAVGFILGLLAVHSALPRDPRYRAPPRSSDVQVIISDAYLSRRIERDVSGRTVPRIRNVHITSVPPNVLIADTDLALGPLSVPATLRLQPDARGGQVVVDILSAHVAGIPVPSLLTGVVAGEINRSTRNLLGSSAAVRSVAVQPGAVKVFASER